MSISNLLLFKNKIGFCGSILRVTVDDATLYGETITLIKDGATILTGVINDNGVCDLVTDISGDVTVTMESQSLSVSFTITFYGTYNVNLNIHSDSGLGSGAGM